MYLGLYFQLVILSTGTGYFLPETRDHCALLLPSLPVTSHFCCVTAFAPVITASRIFYFRDDDKRHHFMTLIPFREEEVSVSCSFSPLGVGLAWGTFARRGGSWDPFSPGKHTGQESVVNGRAFLGAQTRWWTLSDYWLFPASQPLHWLSHHLAILSFNKVFYYLIQARI